MESEYIEVKPKITDPSMIHSARQNMYKRVIPPEPEEPGEKQTVKRTTVMDIMRDHKVLVILFAVLIICLIAIIIWLVVKDNYVMFSGRHPKEKMGPMGPGPGQMPRGQRPPPSGPMYPPRLPPMAGQYGPPRSETHLAPPQHQRRAPPKRQEPDDEELKKYVRPKKTSKKEPKVEKEPQVDELVSEFEQINNFDVNVDQYFDDEPDEQPEDGIETESDDE